jgi:phosphoribosyl 1,2-cyclic phosphodiesterase
VRYTARMASPHPESLRVLVLGSGSAGNSIAVSDGHATVLVDCGFSARETARRLVRGGLDPATVRGILVTHEHTDHTRGIEVFTRRHESVVLASRGTRQAARLDAVAGEVRTVRSGESYRVGPFLVVAFRTSHDAAEPVGYRIETPGGAVVGIATDTGVVTPEAEEALAGCDVLGLESNHDRRMLESGPYPYFLKRRIASDRGHLSNGDAAAALGRLLSPRLRRVVALHRSQTNNTRDLVLDALRKRSAELGFEGELLAADQSVPCGDAYRVPETLFG